jgi:hypothetical protein
MAVRPYTRYHYSTDELVKRFKPALSNTFDVYINTPRLAFGPSGDVNWSEINFMAYEAVLPGTSYELGQVFGDRQGRTEQYPTKRVYPPVDVSFYIDKDYDVIRFFEAWINTMSTNKGTSADSYVTHNYANSYEGEVTITKYERNLRQPGSRLRDPRESSPQPGNVIKYTLRNAFPSNLISIPVSYDGAQILKTTVTFNYDVYFFEMRDGAIENADNIFGRTSGAGGDPPVAGGGQGTTQPLEGDEIINAVNENRRSLKEDVSMLRNMQEASRLRQAGFSPGLGQDGRLGPGF